MSYCYYDIPEPPIASRFEPLEWAKENCASFINVGVAMRDMQRCYYRFYFAKEDDLVMFALRWS